MNALNKTFIIADRICDYIPIVSTISTIVDVVEKVAIKIINPDSITDENKKTNYFSYISAKSSWRCVVAAIPFVNLALIIVDMEEALTSAVPAEKSTTPSDLAVKKISTRGSYLSDQVKTEVVSSAAGTAALTSASRKKIKTQKLKEETNWAFYEKLNRLERKLGHLQYLHTCNNPKESEEIWVNQCINLLGDISPLANAFSSYAEEKDKKLIENFMEFHAQLLKQCQNYQANEGELKEREKTYEANRKTLQEYKKTINQCSTVRKLW